MREGKIFRSLLWPASTPQCASLILPLHPSLAPSTQGFSDFLGQLFQPYTTPSLETPQYEVLKRTKDYQIRRYQPYLVVESPMDEQASSSAQVNPAGPGTMAFQALAGFIFGRNQRGEGRWWLVRSEQCAAGTFNRMQPCQFLPRASQCISCCCCCCCFLATGEKMQMTTPVYSDTQGKMQFVIGPSAHKVRRLRVPQAWLWCHGWQQVVGGANLPRSSWPCKLGCGLCLNGQVLIASSPMCRSASQHVFLMHCLPVLFRNRQPCQRH